MADPTTTTTDQKATDGNAPPPPPLPARRPPDSAVLSGAQKFADGNLHIGAAVMVTSDGNPSTLVMPDVENIPKGAPVYITKPIRIDGKNLKAFLKNKGVPLPEAIGGNDKDSKDPLYKAGLIGNLKISCEAFYFTTTGPLLMMFALDMTQDGGQGGLIKSLTGDDDISKLFDIQGASLRLIRCPASSYSVLQDYVAELTA